MRILDLGCGSNKRKGAIGIDIARGSAADVIADFNQSHLPFKDGAFDHIVSRHVLEHIVNVPQIMEEIWRISKPGACLEGETPHYTSSASYADPTHCHHFGIRTFDFLSSRTRRQPVKIRRLLKRLYRAEGPVHKAAVAGKFEKVEVRLTFNHLLRKFGFEWAANLYPEFYEAFFAFIVPARDIVFRLKTIKSPGPSEG